MSIIGNGSRGAARRSRRVLVLAILAVLTSATHSAAAAPKLRHCEGTFNGTVTTGPDAGLSLSGDLAITIAPLGTVSGTLDEENGGESAVPVSGSVGGEMISLVFDLGHRRRIHGSGSFSRCTGTGVGTLTGPGSGDAGDWGVVWGN